MSSGAEGPQNNGRIAELVQNPFYCVHEPVPAEPPLWTYYNKPIILSVIGGLVLCGGIVLCLLVEFGVADVPSGMGPVGLAVGIMFIAVALVLLPIIREKLRRRGVKTRRALHREQV